MRLHFNVPACAGGTASIEIIEGAIGPGHDPYGSQEIRIKTSAGSAALYSDALGANRFKLRDAKSRIVRELEWYEGCTQHERHAARCLALKCNLLARRWVGLSFDDGFTLYDTAMRTMPEDPMGRLSDYI